ncbi:response regulator, partial [Undibacterium sp.]|uniref:response regulator n=1 Tax=Undibacterium sp. TaxID=1914977 RepID=UPI00374DEE59
MEAERLLMIVEDDAAFARTLSRSFERRGYSVLHAANPDALAALLLLHKPGYAVVDLKLEGSTSGLTCVKLLHQHD